MKQIIYRSQFKKDVRRIKKSHQNLEPLKIVVRLLERGDLLPDLYRDHKLKGNYKDRRECHLAPDLLLIYKCEDRQVILERIGSHSELFR